jgi:hypothetical protein
MRRLVVTIALVSATLLAGTAHGTSIVDTGPGPSDPAAQYYSVYRDQNSAQYLAGKFSISQAYDITGMCGWMYPHVANTTFTIAVYGDGGQIPDTAQQFFAQEVTAGSTAIGWYGLSGLNLALDPGSYWIAFEVRSSETFFGTMPGPAEHPLADYAYRYTGYGLDYGWQEGDYVQSGIQISANPHAAVPDPAIIFLLGSSLAGVVAIRRRFMK